MRSLEQNRLKRCQLRCIATWRPPNDVIETDNAPAYNFNNLTNTSAIGQHLSVGFATCVLRMWRNYSFWASDLCMEGRNVLPVFFFYERRPRRSPKSTKLCYIFSGEPDLTTGVHNLRTSAHNMWGPELPILGWTYDNSATLSRISTDRNVLQTNYEECPLFPKKFSSQTAEIT